MNRDRYLLMALVLWGLVMIVPDLWRVVQPLGSFGLYADNDGLIYDVTGPFLEESASPAYRAGIRVGDRVDLTQMQCSLKDRANCGSALTVLGGHQYALIGRSAAVALLPSAGQPARQVTLVAEQRPSNLVVRGIILLTQVAGILVVLAAAWLVWTRPSAMSWGFFLYVMWFNPGQVYAFYAILQLWPAALLVQDFASAILEAVGYAGLLLFVMRVPRNETEPRWRPLERALPLVAALMAVVLIASHGSLFGYRSEATVRLSILLGFAVDLCALGILLIRRRSQTPEDYQRVRWVIWGCLIGLPAFLIADLGAETTVFDTRWGDFTPSDDILGLLYLVNGIMCLFVFEALRRERVVNVAIPLRRVTLLGLTLSVPALLLHHEADRLQRLMALPDWAWLVIGAVVLFLISRLHESVVRTVDSYFNRALDRAEQELGRALLAARAPGDIDRLLAAEPFRLLGLTSAASFRRQGSRFVRAEGAEGWDHGTTRALEADAELLAPVPAGAPFSVADAADSIPDLPQGLNQPILAVPAVNPVRCFAVSFYGPHATGTDLDGNERAMLARLANKAASMYAELETDELRNEVARLERELSMAASGAGTPSA